MKVLRPRALFLTAVIVCGLVVTRPGFQARAALFHDKWTGAVSLPWREVMVRMAPWSLQPWTRDWLGPAAEPWARSFAGLGLMAAESGRVLLFEGPTANLAKLNCHYSILGGGKSPHPLHTHVDEEIIFPLEGEVEILRGVSLDSAAQVERIGPGQMVFHASDRPHTIRAAGPGPSSYAVMRWTGREQPKSAGLTAQTFDLRPHWDTLRTRSGSSAKQVVVDEATALLRTLHVHLTRLDPGGESPEHVDAHDVVLITVEGVIETLGQQVEAGSMVFLPAHKPHSMRNGGLTPARYLVIEFHGAGAS